MSGELLAGRELDARVAEKVMGWKPETFEGQPWWRDAEGCPWASCEVPRYSTSIAAAWQVVEKLGGYALMERMSTSGLWLVAFGTSGARTNSESYGETAPLAICLAALAAMEGGAQ